MTKKLFINSVAFIIVALLASAKLSAQNTSPYWSLAGNSNATATSKLGTTNVIPLRLFTNNVERMRIETTGRVGIGTATPVNIFTVKATAGSPAASWVTAGVPVFVGFAEAASSEFYLATASNTPDLRPVFSGKRSRGTLASPAAVVNNDYIASVISAAYDGNSFLSPAAINFYVDGAPSSGHVPARISFETGTSRGDRLERLKILNNGNFNFNNGQLFLQQSSGNVGIGTTSPTSKLHLTVNGLNAYQGLAITNTNSGGKTLTINQGTLGKLNFTDPGIVDLMTMDFTSANVGIGTTTPGDKLSIKGGAISFHHTNNDVPYVGIDYDPESDAMRFRANLSSTALNTTNLTIERVTGRVGIGTSFPGAQVEIKALNGRAGLYVDGVTTGVRATIRADNQNFGFSALSGVVFNNTGSPGSFYGVYGEATGGAFNAAGYFKGDVYAVSYNNLSDRKFKTGITPLKNSLQQLMNLKPSSYLFKKEEISKMQLPSGKQIGLVADEVEQVFPELVKDAVQPAKYGKDSTEVLVPQIKYQSINYIGLIPVLIASIQEQQKLIQDQQSQIEELKGMVNQLSLGRNIKTITNNAMLVQNIPNPFDNTTSIGYELPQNFTNAQIKISDKNGKLLRTINVSGSGKGRLNVDAAILSSGAYNYSLYVNGKLISTKQMERLK